jgi:hypothetical protein
MENFLDSSILPGDSVPKHVHRKLFVILIIIVLVAVGILVSLLYYSKGNDATVVTPGVNTSIDPRIQELKKYEVKLTDQQKADAVSEVKKYEVTLTDKEKAARIAEILKDSTK